MKLPGTDPSLLQEAQQQHLQVAFLSAASALEAPSRLRVCASFLRIPHAVKAHQPDTREEESWQR